MSIWRPGNVDIEPEVFLESWSVFEVKGGSRHFCGYNASMGEGRVSSPILEFSPMDMTGTTRSGRTYRLVGPPGINQDARYVWKRWCDLNDLTEDLVLDVTEEFRSKKMDV